MRAIQLDDFNFRRWRTMRGCSLTSIVIWIALVAVSSAQQLAFTLPQPNGEIISVTAGDGGSAAAADVKLVGTAVCFLGTECPMARGYIGKLNELHREFVERGIRIVGVMSNHQDSSEDIARYVAELQVAFPIARDAQNEVADRYGASRTPEVYLLDAELKLRYHGRIDDQLAPGVARAAATRQDLRIAMEELLAGKPISIPATKALGCIIGRVPAADTTTDGESDVTYSNQVVRVLQRNCIECHRSGEIGPFAMDQYEEAVGWAETMLETVENGRMPPWHADPEYGSFANERLMTEADKQVLRDWIASGLKRGDPTQLPETEQYIDGWDLPRQPDVVVAMRKRPFTIPKDGVVEYQYFVADPGFEEDTWVTAAQVIPGARSVVHHAIVFVRPPDGSEFSGIGWLSAYVPGQRVHQLPPGCARKVPAGSKFVFQMHYTPSGVEQQDVTQVGLLLGNPDEVTHEVFTLMAIDQEFEIPPGVADFPVHAKTRWLPPGAELLAITPHMHVRGKSFRLYGTSGDAETILSVPHYDFNWQHTYQLKQPIKLDGFSDGLQFDATFDNSSANPFNPDPTETVTWGDQTWEEMAVAFFEVSRPRTSASEQSFVSTGQGKKPTETVAARKLKLEAYIQRVFAELDADGDGQIEKSEADIVVRRMHFNLWDLDRDDVATADEVRQVAEKLFQL